MNDDTKKPTVDEESYAATQGLVQRLGEQLDQLSQDLKTQRDMLKGIFDNDEQLEKATDAADVANQTIKSRKADLNSSTQVKEIRGKITDLTEELKIVKDSLDNHLVNYFQMTGSKVIDTPDGTEREFELHAKLKPAKKS